MAHIFMRFPNGKKKVLTLSYDDGVDQDIRLISIMKKHGLKGTFNLTSERYAPEGTVYSEGTIHRPMTRKQVTELYKDSGMEVAVHSATHPFLEELSMNVCLQEVVKDRTNLEKQFGTIVRGMAYPYGTYSDQVVECLKCAGIVYSRTTVSTGGFALPSDWMRLPATCHHNDERLMALAKQFVDGVVNNKAWMFYLWGHSYEFDMNDNWDVIEKFAEYIGGKDDIWYATNLEIYDYVEAYKRLLFDMEGTRVFNPTAYEVWLERDKVIYAVKPGEVLTFDDTVVASLM